MATAIITVTDDGDDVAIKVSTGVDFVSMEHPAHVIALAMVHWALQQANEEDE
jgi:hypothetical protein